MSKKNQRISNVTGQCGKICGLAGRLIVLLALSIFGTTWVHAQLSTADIIGTVTDESGAVISRANVTLVNLDTHDQREAVSNDSGDFQFSQVSTGRYSVTVKMTNFKTSTLELSVEAGDRARADIHLTTGGTTETVVVEATTPLLQADSATVSSTVTSMAVQDLPLNGRNFVTLVQLVPGANEGPGNGLTSGGRPDDRRSTSGFSVNGQDDTLNNFVIDGVDDNERIIGTIGVKPSVEGIQEITVQTNSYAPEAGRTAGGVVNVVTKSGTNQFHGSLYEFFRNDKFDARNYFQTTGPEPELRQNQFGGSFGGPIIHDKTFFFGDYEGFRQVNGTTYTTTVPTLAEYNDINSLDGGSPQALINSGNGTAGLPVDPVALAYLQLMPAPNQGTNNYTISPNKTQNYNLFDIRVDHTFNQNNHFFGRYNYNKVNTYTPAAIPAGANPAAPAALKGLIAGGGRYNFAGPANDGGQQYAFGYSHIFSQDLLVDLRAAFTRINNFSQPLNYATNADTTVGFPANGSLTAGLTPIQFGSLSDIGDGAYVPLQDIDNSFQYSGAVSYTVGNHAMKYGAGLIRRQARNVQSAFPFGQYTFGLPSDNINITNITNPATPLSSAQVLQNNLASSLTGAFYSSSFNVDLTPPDYRTWEPNIFAQDNWRVNKSLTLVYGLRYDIFTPFTEAHNRISNFDFNQAVVSSPATVGSALKVAGVGGVSSTAGVQTVYSDIAPRVGFSYSLRSSLVVRGGYGLSFFPGNYTSNADLKNAPFTSVYTPGCESALALTIEGNVPGGVSTGNNPSCATIPGTQTVFGAGLPTPAPQTVTSTGLTFVAEDPKFKPSMIQQFNLQVEQQFGANVLTVGYVGNIGQHLPETINDINVPTPAEVAANNAAPRPLGQGLPAGAGILPNLGNLDWLQSEGVSNYNGLQASFQRRFAAGLAFDANYTWGHALSDVTGFSEEGQQGWSDADPTRIRQIEYGNAENDIRNRFALSINYDLPGKNITGAKKYAVGGWQANGIVAWQSGKDFSITNSSASGGYNDRASPLYNNGPDRPDQVGNPLVPGPVAANPGCAAPTQLKTITSWFNPCAFMAQPLGTVGDAARNSLYGPQFRHVDFSLFKTFPITERLGLQFRAEAFDISNTPNLYIANNVNSGPDTRLGNVNFGQVLTTDPNYVPRQLQFALKLEF